jgi:hypothetical protein
MRKNLLKAIVLLTVGFGMAFADPNQELSREEKVLNQKSVEVKKEDAMDRLNNDLSKIPESVRRCVLSAMTVGELGDCYKQSK